MNKEDVDIFRDTPIRYLGYANEVGEAFRSVVPKYMVYSSYLVASGYVLTDTIHNGLRAYRKEESTANTKYAVIATVDTLLWQTFASIVIPGFTINRICAAARYIQTRSARPRVQNQWIPIVIGLISIPLIIHPIDNAVENIMNSTCRKWTGYRPISNLK